MLFGDMAIQPWSHIFILVFTSAKDSASNLKKNKVMKKYMAANCVKNMTTQTINPRLTK